MEVPVRVAIRLRPMLSHDRAHEVSCVQVIPARGQLVLGGEWVFSFDHALPSDMDQTHLYATCVEPLLHSYFEGYNVTVIAYGQTGSGKTYTMVGPDLNCAMDEAEFGIVPRAVRHMFYKINDFAGGRSGRRFGVRASFLEVYREEVKDLLAMNPYPREVAIREDKEGNTVLVGVQEVDCLTITDVLACLETGISMRHTGTTAMNSQSSRSHSVFIVTLDQAWSEGALVHQKESKFYFVDLAGSERADRTGNTGDRLQESIYINSGLLALGNVISALGDPRRKASYVPYRDSKLTRILKDSLGGTAKTLMVCCVSPASLDFDESLNTLKYARRSRNIRNRPVVNSQVLEVEQPLQQQEVQPVQEPQQQQQDVLFRLQFASHQWQQLVGNAQELFGNLQKCNGVSDDLRMQIQSWLCLKEECDECITNDGTECAEEVAREANAIQRPLEAIEEISEPEEKTETETQSDIASETSDLEEHMESLRAKFWESLDVLIQTAEDAGDIELYEDDADSLENKEDDTPAPPARTRLQNGRRESIHPGMGQEDVLKVACAFAKEAGGSETEGEDEDEEEEEEEEEEAHQSLKEMESTIRLKDAFIRELLRNGRKAEGAKRTFQRRLEELEEEAEATKQDLAAAQKVLSKMGMETSGGDQQATVDACKMQVEQIEGKFREADQAVKEANAKAKRFQKMEDSISSLKEEKRALQRMLKDEENHCASLEKELEKERQRGRELGRRASETNEMSDSRALTAEIHELRTVRDKLAEEKLMLETKEELRPEEERGMVELDEAVEAVDMAIEFKNELLCGRERELSPSQLRLGHHEEDNGLLYRLLNLSQSETRRLLYKYFRKVVDLRMVCIHLEKCQSDIEQINKDLELHMIHKAQEAKRVEMKARNRFAEYEEVIRRLGGNTEGGLRFGGAGEGRHHHHHHQQQQHADEVFKKGCKKRFKELVERRGIHLTNGDRAKWEEALEAGVAAGPSSATQPQVKTRTTVPGQSKSSHGSTTTKVVRARNKLIIQQEPRESRDRAHHGKQ